MLAITIIYYVLSVAGIASLGYYFYEKSMTKGK